MNREELRSREQYKIRRQQSGTGIDSEGSMLASTTNLDDFWVPPPPYPPPPSPPPPPPPDTTPPPVSPMSSSLVDKSKITQFIAGRKSLIRQASGTKHAVSQGKYVFRKSVFEHQSPQSTPASDAHSPLKPTPDRVGKILSSPTPTTPPQYAMTPSPHRFNRTPSPPPPPPPAGGGGACAYSPPKQSPYRQVKSVDTINTPAEPPKVAPPTRPIFFQRDAPSKEYHPHDYHQHPPPSQDRELEEESQYKQAMRRELLKEAQGAKNLKDRSAVYEPVASKNAPPVNLGPMAEIMERRRQMGIHMDSFDK